MCVASSESRNKARAPSPHFLPDTVFDHLKGSRVSHIHRQTELTTGIDDSVVLELHHNKLVQLDEVGLVILVLVVTLIIYVGEEDTFSAIFILVQGIVPILGLDQEILKSHSCSL